MASEIIKQFKNVNELENVIRLIHKLYEQGMTYKEIVSRIFNPTNKRETNRYIVWTSRIIKKIEKEGLNEVIQYLKAKYIRAKEEKEEKKKPTKSKKEVTKESKLEDKLLKASNSAVEKQLTDWIKKISIEQLREIIQNGMLVKQYEEELRQQEIRRYIQAYINEKARRELLNEALLYFLSGMLDQETLARVVLGIALDEMLSPSTVLINAVGGAFNGEKAGDSAGPENNGRCRKGNRKEENGTDKEPDREASTRRPNDGNGENEYIEGINERLRIKIQIV